MRVLIINNVYPDKEHPTEFVFVHKQVKALQRAGYEVCVLDIDLRYIRWKRRLGVYKEYFDGVLVYRVSLPFVTTRLKQCGKKLNEYIGKRAAKRIFAQWGRPDIIHAHFGFGAGNAGAAIKEKFHIPLIITEHSSKILNAQNREECKFSLDAYARADAVLSVGSVLAEKMRSLGVSRVSVLPNIIDSELFTPRKKTRNTRYTFITVGHLIPSKNHKDLLRAFADVNKDGQNRLIIVGTGTEKENLIALSKELNCANTVEFIDSIPNNQLPELLNKADCFAMPSLFETFGVSYAEAISCGIPAISYRNGGTDDIITENVGILTEENSVAALTEAMIRVHEMTFEPDFLHNYIDEKFGTKKFISKIDDVYTKAAKVQI